MGKIRFKNICLFPIIVLLGVQLVHSSTIKSQCLRLPPPLPDAEPQSGQPEIGNEMRLRSAEENLETILNDGMDHLDFDRHNKTAIFILGNTGSGKTTLSLTINANLSRIHAVRTHRNKIVIIDDDDKIGLPSTKSKTFVPNYIVNLNNSVAFYDCPGFDDNRGPEMDIAAMYFVHGITEHVSRAKFLFTVTHSSVKLGHDRNDFDLLAKHASRFLKNIVNSDQSLKKSIGLIVTKVNSYDGQGDYQDNADIMAGISEFLHNYLATLRGNMRLYSSVDDGADALEIRRKIQFVESLLMDENEETGECPKIWFVRTPKCGPFSDNPYAYEVREKIISLYTNNLEFANVTADDFGVTLKDATVLKIRDDFMPKIQSQIIKSVQQELASLGENYESTFETSFNKSNSELDKKVKVLLQLDKDFQNLTKIMRSWNNSEMENVALKISLVDGALNSAKSGISEEYFLATERREKWLKFFTRLTKDSASGSFSDEIYQATLSQSFSTFFSHFQRFHDGIMQSFISDVIPSTRSQIENISVQMLGKMLQNLESQFNKTAVVADESENGDARVSVLEKYFVQIYEKLRGFEKTIENEDLGNSSLFSKDIEILLKSISTPDGNLNQPLIELKYLEENLKQLTKIFGAQKFPEMSFRKIFVQNFLHPYEEWRTRILNKVKSTDIPDLLRRIQAEEIKRANSILNNYEEHISREMKEVETKRENYDKVAILIENLDLNKEKIENFVRNFATSDETQRTANSSIVETMEDLYNKLILPQVTPPLLLRNQKQLSQNMEFELGSLRKICGIEGVSFRIAIVNEILHQLKTRFESVQQNCHNRVRNNIIPEILQELETLTIAELDSTQRIYFSSNEEKVGREAVLQLVSICGSMGKLETSFDIIPRNNVQIVEKMGKIYSALGYSSKSNSASQDKLEGLQKCLNHLEKKAMVAQTNGGSGLSSSSVRLSLILTTFLRQFHRQCEDRKHAIFEITIPRIISDIMNVTKAGLRQIRNEYLKQLGDQNRLGANRRFIEDIGKLNLFLDSLENSHASAEAISSHILHLHQILFQGNNEIGDLPEIENIRKLESELNDYRRIGSVGRNEEHNSGPQPQFLPIFTREVYHPFHSTRFQFQKNVQEKIIPDLMALLKENALESCKNFQALYEESFLEKFIDHPREAIQNLEIFEKYVEQAIQRIETLPRTMNILPQLENIYEGANMNYPGGDSHTSLRRLESEVTSWKNLFKLGEDGDGANKAIISAAILQLQTAQSRFRVKIQLIVSETLVPDLQKKIIETGEDILQSLEFSYYSELSEHYKRGENSIDWDIILLNLASIHKKILSQVPDGKASAALKSIDPVLRRNYNGEELTTLAVDENLLQFLKHFAEIYSEENWNAKEVILKRLEDLILWYNYLMTVESNLRSDLVWFGQRMEEANGRALFEVRGLKFLEEKNWIGRIPDAVSKLMAEAGARIDQGTRTGMKAVLRSHRMHLEVLTNVMSSATQDGMLALQIKREKDRKFSRNAKVAAGAVIGTVLGIAMFG